MVGADYALTFEELYAMFAAKKVDPEAMAAAGVQQGIAFFTALIFRSSSAWVYYESEGK